MLAVFPVAFGAQGGNAGRVGGRGNVGLAEYAVGAMAIRTDGRFLVTGIQRRPMHAVQGALLMLLVAFSALGVVLQVVFPFARRRHSFMRVGVPLVTIHADQLLPWIIGPVDRIMERVSIDCDR